MAHAFFKLCSPFLGMNLERPKKQDSFLFIDTEGGDLIRKYANDPPPTFNLLLIYDLLIGWENRERY